MQFSLLVNKRTPFPHLYAWYGNSEEAACHLDFTAWLSVIMIPKTNSAPLHNGYYSARTPASLRHRGLHPLRATSAQNRGSGCGRTIPAIYSRFYCGETKLKVPRALPSQMDAGYRTGEPIHSIKISQQAIHPTAPDLNRDRILSIDYIVSTTQSGLLLICTLLYLLHSFTTRMNSSTAFGSK